MNLIKKTNILNCALLQPDTGAVDTLTSHSHRGPTGRTDEAFNRDIFYLGNETGNNDYPQVSSGPIPLAAGLDFEEPSIHTAPRSNDLAESGESPNRVLGYPYMSDSSDARFPDPGRGTVSDDGMDNTELWQYGTQFYPEAEEDEWQFTRYGHNGMSGNFSTEDQF